MSTEPTSFRAILWHWATLELFADAMGVPHSTVKNWAAVNAIAPKHWPKLVEVAERWGLTITLPQLNALYVAHRPRRESRASDFA